MGSDARWEAGDALRRIQEGEMLSMPLSRPMPDIGPKVHELRIEDQEQDCIWRIFYRTDSDAIVVAEVLNKKTTKTPKQTIDLCKLCILTESGHRFRFNPDTRSDRIRTLIPI
jgi:phage-related protein